MLRFGIAAILLAVLVVLAAGMLFGGSRSLDPASDGHSGLGKAGADAHARPSVAAEDGQERTDFWTSEIRASLARDLVDARARTNSPGPRYDDLPPFNKEALGVLPSAGTPSAEEAPPEGASSRAPDAPSPVARPAEAGGAERPSAGGEERSTNGASRATHPNIGEPAPRPDAATVGQIAQAQSKLAALGYNPGPADGRLGSRTEAAVRKFRKDARLPPDGLIDDRLLARLDAEARARAPSHRPDLAAIAPGPAPKAEQRRERSVFGLVLGGFQRLLGREFDSVRRPSELAAYCRVNTHTWIYDFGREAFVYCGDVVATQAK